MIGDKDDIIDIDCKIAEIKYTKFEALVNWRINDLGRNDNKLYLVVVILLYGLFGLFFLPKEIFKCG